MNNYFNKILRIGLSIALLLLLSASAHAFDSTDSVGSAIGSCLVLDTEGNECRLGSAWDSKPVVLVFIRHFG